MSKKKSRYSARGGSKYGWDNIELFAFQPIAIKAKTKRHTREAGLIAHAKDRQRQRLEAGTNWAMVRLLLNQGQTLENAKAIARTLL